MEMVPIAGLITAMFIFAAIFFCIRWLVKKQWYSMLSVLSAHVFLGYVNHGGWLSWGLWGDRLLLIMTLICSMLILIRMLTLLGNKKKKRTV